MIPDAKQQEEALSGIFNMQENEVERVKNSLLDAGFTAMAGSVPSYETVMDILKVSFSGNPGRTMLYTSGAEGHVMSDPEPALTVYVYGEDEGILNCEPSVYRGMALYAIFIRTVNLTHQLTLL